LINPKSNSSQQLSSWIKKRASELGFDHCGIAPAAFLESEAPRLEQWLKAGMHGKMQYMENHFEKRLDPRKLVDGAKSVIVFLKNYFPEKEIPQTDNYIISKYAYGRDYHFVIKDKLKQLIAEMKEKAGHINARAFVDSAPVLERAWAAKAGLGWVGKNANFIHPKAGSFFFIAEIITDMEFEYDQPKDNDFCGACRNCIDACPTQAIVGPRIIDSGKCISYLTIELKDKIPETFKGQFQERIFGCDICQDVCPWNRFSKHHHEPQFNPANKLTELRKKDWEELSEETFREIFRNSAVKRTQFAGLMRNIKF
jgi:epoxyqueuosine reductase